MNLNKKKVVFIRTTSVINEPRVIKEAKVVKKMGLSPLVVFWDRLGNDKQLTEYEGIKLSPIYVGYSGYGKGIFNVHKRVLVTYEVIKKLKRENPFIIHACDLDGLIPTILYKKFFNKNTKIIYDIFDFIWTVNSPIPNFVRNFLKNLEQYLLKYVDYIILPDENRVNFIKKNMRKKITIVNNAPEISIDYTFKKDYNGFPFIDKNKINIFYAGSLSKDRGIEWLIDIAKNFPEKFNIIVAGIGILKDKIKLMSEKLKNFYYLGKLSVADIYQIYPFIDIVYIMYNPIFLHNKYSSPTKLFEALHFGKPVIINKGIYWDKKVEEFNCGWVIDYDKKLLFNILNQLDKLEIERKSRNTEKLYELVKWENSKKNLIKLYRSLINEE